MASRIDQLLDVMQTIAQLEVRLIEIVSTLYEMGDGPDEIEKAEAAWRVFQGIMTFMPDALGIDRFEAIDSEESLELKWAHLTQVAGWTKELLELKAIAPSLSIMRKAQLEADLWEKLVDLKERKVI